MAAPASVPVAADEPLLSYHDDATGERTELTTSELGAWAARSAGLLRDGCGLRPGDRVAVLLPPHWRTAAVLLGAWSVGLTVSFRPRALAGLPVLEPGADRPYDAVFVTPERLDWLEDVPEGRTATWSAPAPARSTRCRRAGWTGRPRFCATPPTRRTAPPWTRPTRPPRTAPASARGDGWPRRSPGNSTCTLVIACSSTRSSTSSR
ncbi:TIGR03089 family protein [Micromonospora sp. NPDC050980]|uniref:TIGR03089 family protein n=1 Tax=Micromonospora sp. NPDC050980 TaxID=3155161 RepID=UPI0033C02139